MFRFVKHPFKKGVRGLRAVSPVIATLLLISIAVASSLVTYLWVMDMVGTQANQAQTQFMIQQVDWNGGLNMVKTKIKNTGSLSVTIESISIRVNIDGSLWLEDSVAETTSINVGSTAEIVWTSETALSPSSSYVIRVMCNTGFYNEMISTTPELAS